MPSKVQMKPTSTIKAYLGITPNGRVQKFFTNTCYKHMDKYVPKSNLISSGNLRTIVDIESNKIIYEVPYAHAQYVGYTKGPVRNYTTPGTGPYWDKRMVSAEMDKVVEEVQNYIGRSK